MALLEGVWGWIFITETSVSPSSPQKPNPITQLESKALHPRVQLQSDALAAPILCNTTGERQSTTSLSASPEMAAAGPSLRSSLMDPSSGSQQHYHSLMSTVEVSRAFQRWLSPNCGSSPATPGLAVLLGWDESSNRGPTKEIQNNNPNNRADVKFAAWHLFPACLSHCILPLVAV